MKALVCVKPKELEYIEKERPSLQKGKSIIKIKRIGICGTDLHAFEGEQPYFEYPRILGHEISGELLEGDEIPGDKKPVTFIPYNHCGKCIACRMGKTNCCTKMQVSGVHVDGGMVEFLSVPSELIIEGGELTFDELALVEPLAIGAHGVSRANIQKDEFVLVIGAGPIGLGTMEFAKIAGGKVIALDVNESRLTFCREKINIQHTVNAFSDNPFEDIKQITNGEMPTVIIDATGNQNAINNSFQYMAHGGRYVLIGLQKGEVTFSHPEFHKREGTLMSSRNATRIDFEYVINCIKEKKVNPQNYITHKVQFGEVKTEFENWLDPASGVIKAMVEIN